MPGRTELRPEKRTRVQALAQSIQKSPMTALIGIRGVPAAAMQKIRRDLRERGHPMVVAPNSALRHAIELAAAERPALRQLLDHVTDQTALLVAEGNPFGLAHELTETRSATPARGGEVAPHDIIVPSGATSFKPGPIVGELQQAGFPAAIEKGRVVLKKDTTIVKAGSKIPRPVATLLTRMEILPLEAGLDLRALLDGSTFYPGSILAVDLGAQRNELVAAHQRAIRVALELAWTNSTTLPLLVARAFRQAMTVATRVGYVTRETIPALVARAVREAHAVERLSEGQSSK